MKVREFIELLQKENPESDIHFDIDTDLLVDEYDWMHTENFKVLGLQTRYQDAYGDIRTKENLIEKIMIENDLTKEPSEKVISKEIQKCFEITGLWIRIET